MVPSGAADFSARALVGDSGVGAERVCARGETGTDLFARDHVCESAAGESFVAAGVARSRREAIKAVKHVYPETPGSVGLQCRRYISKTSTLQAGLTISAFRGKSTDSCA